MKWICGLLAALLVGCTTIDSHTTPPSDWPNLAVAEHVVSSHAMLDACMPYMGFLQFPLACAIIFFEKLTCDIYVTGPAHLEHERMHCAGYDHIGDSTLRDAWEEYKSHTP